MYIFSLVRGGGGGVESHKWMIFSLFIFYSSLCNFIFIVSYLYLAHQSRRLGVSL